MDLNFQIYINIYLEQPKSTVEQIALLLKYLHK